MSNFYKDNDDLRYYFERGIDWDMLVRLTEADYNAEGAPENLAAAQEFYKEILEMFGEFVATEVAPYAREIDEGGVKLENGEGVFCERLENIFQRIAELELHGMCLPRDLGGMNVPMVVYWMLGEMFARGDVSAMAHHSFHGGMAMAMLFFSVEEGTTEVDLNEWKISKTRWEKEIGEIARGEAWGCMDITEPHAGSDMAKLKTFGEQDDDGNWFVTGQKIFITSGHGKYHFVIARTEKSDDTDDPFAGLGGLSMFLVPTYEDLPDGTRKRIVTVDRLEEKLGHHGSATAALSFDRAPAQLVGKRGEGFRYMLLLMNNARIGVGVESIGVCEAALRCAKDYAAERKSMGKTIDRHEMIADYIDEMETDIMGLRAMALEGALAEELTQKLRLAAKYGGKLLDPAEAERESDKNRRLARRITPLLKYLAAEKAVEMARRALQIHGGAGYITEYDPERLLRDALVMPIYEGTSQIQALMAMKDTLMGILKNPQDFVRRAAQARFRALSRDPLERRVAKLQVLSSSTLQFMMTRIATNKMKGLAERPVNEWAHAFLKEWNPKKDFAFAMLHAERLTKLLADEMICELLLRQARKHPERRPILEAYLDRAEPRCRGLHDEITTTGGRLLAKLAELEEPAVEAAE